LKQLSSKRAVARRSPKPPIAAVQPVKGQLNTSASKESRNKANTIRNTAKIEQFLMEVEKVHGFARSWAMRERLEQGQVSFDELLRR
jgi:hypothetical protein